MNLRAHWNMPRDILPGCRLKLVEAAPLQGPLTLQVNGKEVALGLAMAEFIVVKVS